jgi:hypothetical protein
MPAVSPAQVAAVGGRLALMAADDLARHRRPAGGMLIRRYKLKARWDSRNVFRLAWPFSRPPDRSRSAGG